MIGRPWDSTGGDGKQLGINSTGVLIFGPSLSRMTRILVLIGATGSFPARCSIPLRPLIDPDVH